jgi:hypothetical protein
MYCPACGAESKQQDQKYCQDCGATLPTQGGPGSALLPRGATALSPVAGTSDHDRWLHLIPVDVRNRFLLGAGVAVLAVVILYVVINAIVSFLLHLVLPVVVVLAILYAGYRIVRAKRS